MIIYAICWTALFQPNKDLQNKVKQTKLALRSYKKGQVVQLYPFSISSNSIVITYFREMLIAEKGSLKEIL